MNILPVKILLSCSFCIVLNRDDTDGVFYSMSLRILSFFVVFIDHELIILTNNNTNQKIFNVTRPNNKLRDRIKVGVAYGTDIEKVEKSLYESAIKHPNVLKN